MSGKSIIEQFPKPKIIQFLNIGDNSTYTDSAVNVDEPLFQPEPHVIQFTNYEALQIKEQILKLRNKDKVARCVKIIPPDSKLFQVHPCKKNKGLNIPAKAAAGNTFQKPSDVDIMQCRVAPGMEISYVIQFSPEAKIDYSYDLMVVTEREKFVVPIRAVGCRAMLDFPDSLDFGLVPVKHTAEKPVMIRNVGEKTTKWHIKVPNGFKVANSQGILEVGNSEQLVF